MSDEKKTQAQLNADVKRARSDLAATFDAIENKLNLPRRFKRGTKQTSDRLRVLARENPVLLATLAVGAVVTVGGAIWGIAKAVSRE